MNNYIRNIFLIALPALLLAGCAKGLENKENGACEENGIEVLSGNALRGITDETKTHLTADGRMVWSDGDQVLLLGATGATLDVIPLGNDASHGFLAGGTIPAPANGSVGYTALYPASMFSSVTSASAISASLPVSYTCPDCQTNPLKCYPMIAQSNNKVLDFEGIFGMLEINLVGEMAVTSIVVSTTSADKHLAGDFSYNPINGNVDFTGTEDVVTIECGETGIRLSNNAPAKFYLPLVAGDYENVKVKVNTVEMNSKGGSCEHTVADFTIEKGMIYASTFKADRNAVQLWPGGPYWATCNVGAKAPYEYGDYFAWGQTTPPYSSKSVTGPSGGLYTVTLSGFTSDYSTGFNWKSYFTVDPWGGTAAYTSDPGATAGFKKYGTVGATLSDADDAAFKNWGPEWHIPTSEEYEALGRNCYAEWTNEYKNDDGEDVQGLIVYYAKDFSHKGVYKATTGVYYDMFASASPLPEPSPAPSYDCTRDRHIFLPRSGHINNLDYDYSNAHGFTWSSTVTGGDYCWQVSSPYWGDGNEVKMLFPNNRYWGVVVRPVKRSK